MEEIRVIKNKVQHDSKSETWRVNCFGFAHDWQSLITAVVSIQQKSPLPATIEKIGDFYIVRAEFLEVIGK